MRPDTAALPWRSDPDVRAVVVLAADYRPRAQGWAQPVVGFRPVPLYRCRACGCETTQSGPACPECGACGVKWDED